MIVLDASAAIEFLLATPIGDKVRARIAAADVGLHAPYLLDLEVAQVLRRWEQAKKLPTARARAALDDLAALDVSRYPHDVLMPRIWELRANASAYDAAYLALAEALGAELLTVDAALATVPATRARVVVVR